MEYDIDDSGYHKFMEQTLDIKEWGGFQQIVIFSEIYCTRIEIHSFGNEIQFSDGDDFITNKECVSLLHCNRRSWGEQPNHYDLLHAVKQTHKPGDKNTSPWLETKLIRFKDWEGDVEAREKYNDTNQKQHILYKEELEDGTRITSINLSGSRFDFIHVRTLQRPYHDHSRALEIERGFRELEESGTSQGWQGVWEVAIQTEHNEDGADQEGLLF
eukprot:16433932-Heterocapsa_arctica.AAC.1